MSLRVATLNSWLAMGVVLVVLVLDQITKMLIVQNISYREEIVLVPGLLNLVYIRNKGSAFGLGAHSFGEWWPDFLLMLTIMASGFVIYLLVLTLNRSRLGVISLSLILGGALGNISDRIRTGSVVDFIDFHISTAHWPAFNLADSAVTLGGILLFVYLVVEPRQNPSRE